MTNSSPLGLMTSDVRAQRGRQGREPADTNGGRPHGHGRSGPPRCHDGRAITTLTADVRVVFSMLGILFDSCRPRKADAPRIGALEQYARMRRLVERNRDPDGARELPLHPREGESDQPR